MHTLPFPSFKVLSLAALALVASTAPAAAKMKVIESDVPEIAVNSEWDDEASLKVPPGKSVRVLILPSNVTKVISGPKAETDAERSAPWGGTRGVGAEGEDGQ